MTPPRSSDPPETPFGARLRAARKMAGMSMEDLAGKLDGRVTKQAISKYEQGRMMPSPEVLEKLVEVLKIATWDVPPLERVVASPGPEKRGINACIVCDVHHAESLPRDESLPSLTVRRARAVWEWGAAARLDGIRFRAGEKLAAKTEEALKYRIADHLQKYLELESILGRPVTFENPVAGLPVTSLPQVEAAAAEARRRWDLGTGPAVNLLGLLDDKGIKIYETRGIAGFEGLSGRFGAVPFIAIGMENPADRIRFTAAHELGHLLCGFGGAESPESDCHAFGAAFLLPPAALEKAFSPARRKVTLGDLGEIKRTYGVSLQAIMYRAHGLGLVSDRQLRSFRETLKTKGWLVEEPVAYEGPERAARFRRLLRYAVAAGILDLDRAAEMAGVGPAELAKEIGEIF